MDLSNLRREIDATDTEIIKLIAKRIGIAGEIGRRKEQIGKAVEDKGREQQVLDAVRRDAREMNISPDDAVAIYRQIIAASKRIQGATAAFQGEHGAYGEEAAISFFGPSVEVRPCEDFAEVFKTVEDGVSQFGVVPVENSLEGSISRVYDLMLNSSLRVRGEIELRVSHCLIVHAGTKLDDIRKVYSHPQALGQCQRFLKHLGAEIVPTNDTAGSVKMIQERGILDGAAVASARAAEIYGMSILAREIEDNTNNYTRFFVLAEQDSPPTGNDKTSVVFSLNHRPGALYEALNEFATRKVNLVKI
jgi:chorismate mutase/prephenate dehydratase